MKRWKPTLLGMRRTESPTSRADDVIVANRSPFGTKIHALTGRSLALRKYLQQSDASVVHAHFATDAWLVVKSAQRANIPLVVTVHARDVTAALSGSHWLKNAVMKYRVRYALSRASKVLVVSDFISGPAIRAGARPENLVRHYTGTPIPSPVDMEKQWDVVFVGRLVEKKGVDDLVLALRLIDDSRLRVAIVGDGPLRERLATAAVEMSSEIEFKGMLPPNEVQSVIARSTLLAAPSKTGPDGDIEGLPTVIIEALALGVPVVATTHSGIPEAVKDGVTGRLVAEGDVEGLAAALDELTSAPAVARSLGRTARAEAEDRFDIDKQTAQLELLYDQVSYAHAH